MAGERAATSITIPRQLPAVHQHLSVHFHLRLRPHPEREFQVHRHAEDALPHAQSLLGNTSEVALYEEAHERRRGRGV